MKKQATVRLTALTLTLLIVFGAILTLGAEGDQNDPLITLGYLNQVVTPETEAKVAAAVKAAETALSEQFDGAIADLTARLEDKLSGSDAGASFVTIALTDGQTLSCKAGAEFVVRSGGAKAAGTLLDVTAGSTVSSGTTLAEHHLCVTQVAGAALTAAGETSVMVRGGFTIQ